MKASELLKKSVEQLEQDLLSVLREQFECRMQNATGQLGQNHKLRVARKNVARIKTILNQKKQAG